MKTPANFFLPIALFSALAKANDSSMGLAAGNITFKQSDGIAMVSEDLYISPKSTRVRYEFQNQTAQDIKTLVGFPIPPISLDDDGDKNFNPDNKNPLDFSTQVDGKKVPVKMLRSQNNGMLEYTYMWEQTFPAGKTLVVEHQYHTRPTISFFSPELNEPYCIEADAAARINKMQPSPLIFEVGYILKTGANWKGPINRFRLVVDKLKQDAIVSLCAHGIRKIGPTRFEMLKADFKPQDDLRILFVKPGAGKGFDW